MRKSLNFLNLFATVCVLGAMLFAVLPGKLFADEDDSEVKSEEVFYSFSEHLYGADASIITKGREALGKWIDESFLFKGYSKDAAVKLTEVTLDEQAHKVIIFNPVSKGFRRLRFSDVPPASKMNIYYKVDQSKGAATEPVYLYFKILLGSHELKRIRISSQDKDWKNASFDLGVAAFFMRDIVVTFELVSDSDQIGFSFFGDIQP